MSAERKPLGLSERWTKIAIILPSNISSSNIRHPDLLVDPSGFRRVVQTSLKTCEEFLNTLQKIEDALEKRMNGITSYYGLVVAPKEGDIYTIRYPIYSGTLSVSGAMVNSVMLDRGEQASRGMMAANIGTSTGYPPSTAPEPEPEIPKESIFERHGDAILHNGYKLEPKEVISFERALEILSKLNSLRKTTTTCLTSFGALDEILEVGKIFSYRQESKVEYFGEHAINNTVDVKEDMVPLSNYWDTLSCVNRIKTISKKLVPNLVNL